METVKDWSDSSTGPTRHGQHNIRRDVEVAVVREDCREKPDRITVPGVDENPAHQTHYAYARGPIRGHSFRHSGGRN